MPDMFQPAPVCPCWPRLQSVLSKSAAVVSSTATHTCTIHSCVVSVYSFMLPPMLMSLHPASPGFLSLGHVFSAFLLLVSLPLSTVSGTLHKHLGMTVSVTGQLTVCSLLSGSQCYSFHGIFRHNCSMLSRFVFVCTKHKAAGCPKAFCKGIAHALIIMYNASLPPNLPSHWSWSLRRCTRSLVNIAQGKSFNTLAKQPLPFPNPCPWYWYQLPWILCLQLLYRNCIQYLWASKVWKHPH